MSTEHRVPVLEPSVADALFTSRGTLKDVLLLRHAKTYADEMSLSLPALACAWEESFTARKQKRSSKPADMRPEAPGVGVG